MENPKSCDSCKRDLRLFRWANCQKCDTTFDADLVDLQQLRRDTGMVDCRTCRRAVPAYQDIPTLLCKYCMRECEQDPEPRPDTGQAPGATALPEPTQGDEEEERPWSSLHDNAPTASKANQLWRLMGCVCDNREPDCFQLLQSEWSRKSLYCLDCKQPYSAFLWSNELPRGQCPRCNGAKVVEDAINVGDTVIKCLNCKSLVSKRRFDSVDQEMRADCNAEDRAAGREPNSALGITCTHCDSAEVRLILTECDGNPCVMRICDMCGSAEFLAGWNRSNDRIGLAGRETDDNEPRDQGQLRTRVALDGFEELTHGCGDLSCLHPVEDDPLDDLLMCAKCDALFSLRACKDDRIPKTVTALRRALKGTFSSGKMGRPFGKADVASLADLKPGDQLGFKRTMYSHYAIVDEPKPESQEVIIIEYTGELNRRTILAFLKGQIKACVKRSRLSFKAKRQKLYKVNYHSVDCFHPRAVLTRAAAMIGEEKYSLITRNCEHFSNWAKANVSFSRQVEWFKERAKSSLRVAVMNITDVIDDLPRDGSIRAAVTILQDIRAEMLRVLDPQNNTPSLCCFWCPVRLLLKWMIRRIPLAVGSIFNKTAACKLFWNMDCLLGPLANKVTDIFPIADNGDEKDDNEKADGKTLKQLTWKP